MSDDEADPELLELLRQSLGLSKSVDHGIPRETGVLKDAEFIYDNAIDVSVDMFGTKAAAESIYMAMKERGYSTQSWGEQELHPTREQGFSDMDIVNFVFTLDLLNFSFWSELGETGRFQVEYNGKRWTGYKSLLACLRLALDENIPITTPQFWIDHRCSDEKLKHVFRSATAEEMPLLQQRIAILRETGRILTESFGDLNLQSEGEIENLSHDIGRQPTTVPEANRVEDGPTINSNEEPDRPNNGNDPDVNALEIRAQDDALNVTNSMPVIGAIEQPESERSAGGHADSRVGSNPISSTATPANPDLSVIRLIEKAEHSAGRLVNLLVKHIPSFRDEARFNGQKVRFYKRAQIFVADLWAASNGTGFGDFIDIAHLTMFADYRVPQMLRSLGVLVFSPPLEYAIRDQREIAPGHSWEVQLRGCSIWAVELIRREILRQHPEASEINAVLIDFFLYDLAKAKQAHCKSSCTTLSELQREPWHPLDLLFRLNIVRG